MKKKEFFLTLRLFNSISYYYENKLRTTEFLKNSSKLLQSKSFVGMENRRAPKFHFLSLSLGAPFFLLSLVCSRSRVCYNVDRHGSRTRSPETAAPSRHRSQDECFPLSLWSGHSRRVVRNRSPARHHWSSCWTARSRLLQAFHLFKWRTKKQRREISLLLQNIQSQTIY